MHEAAAALLLYRITYFLVPFLLAIITLALFEAMTLARGTTAISGGVSVLNAIRPALKAAGPVIPLAISAMIFGSGLLMSFSALVPPLSKAAETTEVLFPLAFVEGGRCSPAFWGLAWWFCRMPLSAQ